MHNRILIGLLLGVVAGVSANAFFGGTNPNVEWFVFNITEPIGDLFLRLLLLTVIPLVFSSLVIGVAGIGDIRKLGRIGLKCFVYTLIVSSISVVIGIGLCNLIRPGQRIEKATADALVQRYGAAANRTVQAAPQNQAQPAPLMQVIRTIVPANPFAAIAGDTPNMLHTMFFAVILAIAITLLPRDTTEPVTSFFESMFQIAAKIIDIIMKFAPYAVACLLFTTTARFGFDLIRALGWFVLTVLLGLSLHMFGVYSLSLALLSRISPIEFFKRIKTVMVTAFSTSSSNATLPTALRISERTSACRARSIRSC